MSAVCVRPLESVLDGAPRLDESTTTSPAPRAMTFISYQCGNTFSFFFRSLVSKCAIAYVAPHRRIRLPWVTQLRRLSSCNLDYAAFSSRLN